MLIIIILLFAILLAFVWPQGLAVLIGVCLALAALAAIIGVGGSFLFILLNA